MKNFNIKKIIKEEFNKFIHEIGEGNAPLLPYKIQHENTFMLKAYIKLNDKINIIANYYIDTDINELYISFDVEDNDEYGRYETINLGLQYRLLATIIKIAKDFVKEFNERFPDKKIKIISFYKLSDKRSKFYLAYIKHMFGNDVKIRTGESDDDIVVELPKDYEEKLTTTLNEIGEGNARVLPYRRVNYSGDEYMQDQSYIITLENNTGTIAVKINIMSENNKTALEIFFDYIDPNGNRSGFKSVNLNVQYSILSTIVKILKDVAVEYERKYHKKINEIHFSAMKESGEDDRRENFYMQYIQKQIPNAKTYKQGDDIIVQLPN